MDAANRLAAAQHQKRLQRLGEVLENRQLFEKALRGQCSGGRADGDQCNINRTNLETSEKDVLVCARIRPILDHEENAGYFPLLGKVWQVLYVKYITYIH